MKQLTVFPTVNSIIKRDIWAKDVAVKVASYPDNRNRFTAYILDKDYNPSTPPTKMYYTWDDSWLLIRGVMQQPEMRWVIMYKNQNKQYRLLSLANDLKDAHKILEVYYKEGFAEADIYCYDKVSKGLLFK